MNKKIVIQTLKMLSNILLAQLKQDMEFDSKIEIQVCHMEINKAIRSIENSIHLNKNI